MRLDPAGGDPEPVAKGAIGGHELVLPNALAFDRAGRLYVTESNSPTQPGPGIFRIETDGAGSLWSPGPFLFANGIGSPRPGRRLCRRDMVTPHHPSAAARGRLRRHTRTIRGTARRTAGRRRLRARRPVVRGVLPAEPDSSCRRRRARLGLDPRRRRDPPRPSHQHRLSRLQPFSVPTSDAGTSRLSASTQSRRHLRLRRMRRRYAQNTPWVADESPTGSVAFLTLSARQSGDHAHADHRSRGFTDAPGQAVARPRARLGFGDGRRWQ